MSVERCQLWKIRCGMYEHNRVKTQVRQSTRTSFREAQ